MDWNHGVWQRSVELFGEFMDPLARGLGRLERREGAACYVQGLLMPGGRKSIEPMAERLGVDKQKLQQFVSDSPWEAETLWEALRSEVLPVLGSVDSWIVDETGWIKQGDKSVGVAHQYCGSVGKKAKCQVSVHLAACHGEAAAPMAARLFLPEAWTRDQERRQRAGIPEDIVFRSKPEIALDLVTQVMAEGLEPAPLLGDCQYGHSGPLREGLRNLGCPYMLQVESALKAWTQRPRLRRARTRWASGARGAQARSVLEIAKDLPASQWHPCCWSGARGRTYSTRLAWVKVWMVSDLQESSGELPETWLVIDWPEQSLEPYHIYTAWLDGPPDRISLLRLSRQRFQIEQYFQRDKDDLGLDHFEGRSWRGFHHHLALAAAAYLFILLVYLRAKKNFFPHVGGGSSKDPAIVDSIARLLPVLQNEIQA
jgi:SRSO17 transposase